MQRVRAWVRDELSRVVRSEIAESNAHLEQKFASGITELHTDITDNIAIRLSADHEAHEANIELQQSRDLALAQAITQLADAITSLNSRINADVEERHLHLSSVEWLMRELIISFPQPTRPTDSIDKAQPEFATIIGGTIEHDRVTELLEVPRTTSDEIDLREAERAVGMLVEVRSRFHDRWIRGFEIVDIIDVSEVRRFRLSRISDRMALPVLFDSNDIRPLPVQPEFNSADHTV